MRLFRWIAPIAVVATVLIVTACASSTSESTTQESVTNEVNRPSEPAAPDEYRADSAAHVASTGDPQLVEFFAFW